MCHNFQILLQIVTYFLEYFSISCHLVSYKEKNTMEQDILIYIDDKEKLDASVAANSFASKDIKNRVYINTLGAELALKYLVSENFDVSNIKNIHSIKKILEDTDIADIMLPNIHIDVRVVFDENQIFIPKSHFEQGLLPDIYLILQLSQDQTFVKFLGFVEPKLINKNNANSEYYFIEKEKLNSAYDLVKYINLHNNSTDKKLSDNDIETSERFIVSMCDNDISENDKKYLLEQLTKSAELRDKFIEYENFETLSYKAMNDLMIEKKEPSQTTVEDVLNLDEMPPFEENNETENSEIEETQEVLQVDNLEQGDVIDVETLDISRDTVKISAIDDYTFGTTQDYDNEVSTVEDISFENIELPETHEYSGNSEITPIELDEPEIPQTIFEETSEEPFSIDYTETLHTEEFTPDDTDMISLDDVESIETEEIKVDETVDDLTSFGNLESTFPEETVNAVEENELTPLDDIELISSEIPAEEEIPIEEVPSINFEEVSEPMNYEQEESLPPEFVDITNSDFDYIAEDEHKSEDLAFGKNLLENLSAENEENIEIKGFSEQSPQHENISSDDLLSQIDNVLNTSSIADAEEIKETNKIDTTENIIKSEETGNDTPTEEMIDEGCEVSDEDEMPKNNIDDISEGENELNILYNEETSSAAEELTINNEEPDTDNEGNAYLGVPGAALYNKKTIDKKSLITASAIIAVLTVAYIFYFLKPKDNTTDIEPVKTNNEIMIAPQSTSTDDDLLVSNTPQIPVQKEVKATKPVVKELKNNPQKPIKSESYLEVNKLVWDVSDALSHSTKIQNYLRTAGRSIKLSLSADLLLATEYAYTNQVKVGLKLSQNGSLQEARILSSSGSTQIDNIVLQSVKDTLNAVKPPNDEINTPDFNLNLIIYF